MEAAEKIASPMTTALTLRLDYRLMRSETVCSSSTEIMHAF